MKEVAKLQIKDRTELFQATAISMGMQPNVIEKDFWVCFMLDHLFHDCRYKNAFVFKGGTSLSKQLCLLTQTPPCMKVDCSVLRTPAIAAGIRKSPQSFHSCGFFAHTGLPVQCLCVSPCKHAAPHSHCPGLS